MNDNDKDIITSEIGGFVKPVNLAKNPQVQKKKIEDSDDMFLSKIKYISFLFNNLL